MESSSAILATMLVRPVYAKEGANIFPSETQLHDLRPNGCVLTAAVTSGSLASRRELIQPDPLDPYSGRIGPIISTIRLSCAWSAPALTGAATPFT